MISIQDIPLAEEHLLFAVVRDERLYVMGVIELLPGDCVFHHNHWSMTDFDRCVLKRFRRHDGQLKQQGKRSRGWVRKHGVSWLGRREWSKSFPLALIRLPMCEYAKCNVKAGDPEWRVEEAKFEAKVGSGLVISAPKKIIAYHDDGTLVQDDEELPDHIYEALPPQIVSIMWY